MMKYKFELNDTEAKAFLKFKKKREKKDPTIPTATGGRFSIVFTPHGIGTMIEVIDNQTGKQKDITDVTNW